MQKNLHNLQESPLLQKNETNTTNHSRYRRFRSLVLCHKINYRTETVIVFSVAISPVTVEAKAYLEPNGGDQAGANQAATIGATSGTGALGGIIGSLVGEAIAATQNTMFKGESAQYFEAAKANTPAINAPVTDELTKAIKADSFYGSRLRDTSPNTFTSKVVSYGLVRSGKTTDGNILLAAQVILISSSKTQLERAS